MKEDFDRLQERVKKRIEKDNSAVELVKLTMEDKIYKVCEKNRIVD